MRRLLRLLLMLGAVWLAGLIWYAETLPHELVDDDLRTDGIVVLTGGQNRLPEAVALLAAGRANRLLISGVNPEIGDAELKEALGLSGFRGHQLFACCIDVGRSAPDTVGNAYEIAEWAAKHKYESLRVVTAGYHMPRSLLEIERLAPDLILVAHPVFSDTVKLDNWWQYPGTARVVAGEYSKFLVTVVKIHVYDRIKKALEG